jgi:hypothetical protein
MWHTSGMNTMPIDQLRRILSYNPETGELVWLVPPARWKKAGTKAGTLRRDRYILVCWKKRLYPAARIAWALQTGQWPEHEVDHINRDPSDNRWSNLREATSAQNKNNRAVRKDSRTGVKGVMPHPDGRFRAKIRHEGRHIHLGLFVTIEAAAEAYRKAAAELHGEFNPESA